MTAFRWLLRILMLELRYLRQDLEEPNICNRVDGDVPRVGILHVHLSRLERALNLQHPAIQGCKQV